MMKVLFVDDDPVIRRLGEYVLESVGGMTVTVAADGKEALAVVDELQPDVIVLDYMMPGMDGDEVLAHLQSSSVTRSIPVVFLTGLFDGPERDALLEAGAAGCIPKPFDPTSLVSEVVTLAGFSGVSSPQQS